MFSCLLRRENIFSKIVFIAFPVFRNCRCDRISKFYFRWSWRSLIVEIESLEFVSRPRIMRKSQAVMLLHTLIANCVDFDWQKHAICDSLFLLLKKFWSSARKNFRAFFGTKIFSCRRRHEKIFRVASNSKKISFNHSIASPSCYFRTGHTRIAGCPCYTPGRRNSGYRHNKYHQCLDCYQWNLDYWRCSTSQRRENPTADCEQCRMPKTYY